jgi:hypothetical protein
MAQRSSQVLPLPTPLRAEVDDVKYAAEHFPLIRACLLWDPLRVAEDCGVPVDDLLAQFLLSRRMLRHPCRPIPMGSSVAILAVSAERAGPDFLLRLVSDAGWLARLQSNFVAGEKNPLHALRSLPGAAQHNFTHLEVEIEELPLGGLSIRGKVLLPFDQLKTHIIHLYAVETIRAVCAAAAPGLDFGGKPPFSEVEMVPHPDGALAHLEKRYGRIVPSKKMSRSSSAFSILILGSVVRSRFREKASRGRWSSGRYYRSLHPPDLFIEMASVILRAMLKGPSAAQFAQAAGFSLSTQQRKLREEGYTFPQFLREVRSLNDRHKPERPVYFRKDPMPLLWSR